MLQFSERFERFVSQVLLCFALLILGYQVVQLAWNTFHDFQVRFAAAGLAYAPEYGHPIAILFFNMLLLLAIIQTLKVFTHSHIVKVRIIMIVCLIAASRKILAMGERAISPEGEGALAVLILSLAAGYYLVSFHRKDPVMKDEHQ